MDTDAPPDPNEMEEDEPDHSPYIPALKKIMSPLPDFGSMFQR